MVASRMQFWDPAGARFGMPTYPWNMAPRELATRRQLAADRLSPRGEPVAQVLWNHRTGTRTYIQRVAYLYATADAAPKRPVTASMAASLEAAMAARRWCPICERDVGYCISRRHGMCGGCVAADAEAN
jgi:hypothetical protein